MNALKTLDNSPVNELHVNYRIYISVDISIPHILILNEGNNLISVTIKYHRKYESRLKEGTRILLAAFWSHLCHRWSPGTRSVCAEGALPDHVAPLSHSDHPVIVIFEKQSEKSVKPIMRQRLATQCEITVKTSMMSAQRASCSDQQWRAHNSRAPRALLQLNSSNKLDF